MVVRDLARVEVGLDSLRRNDARYSSLLLASASIVWVASPEGEFVAPQPAWQEYTGQEWEEYRGSKWISAVDPGFACILLVNGLALMPLVWFGNEEQKTKWLSEACNDGTNSYLAGWVVSEPPGRTISAGRNRSSSPSKADSPSTSVVLKLPVVRSTTASPKFFPSA